MEKNKIQALEWLKAASDDLDSISSRCLGGGMGLIPPVMYISIIQVGTTIEKIVSYEDELYFNDIKPNETMIKLTNPSNLHTLMILNQNISLDV